MIAKNQHGILGQILCTSIASFSRDTLDGMMECTGL